MNQYSTSKPSRDALININSIGIGLGFLNAAFYLSFIYLSVTEIEFNDIPKLLLFSSVVGLCFQLLFNFLQKTNPTDTSSSLMLVLVGGVMYYASHSLINGGTTFSLTGAELAIILFIPITTTVSKINDLVILDLLDIRSRKQFAAHSKTSLYLIVVLSAVIFSLLIPDNQTQTRDKVELFMLVGSGSSILCVIIIQLSSLKNQTLNDLKWNKQLLEFENRPLKLIKNRHYRVLFGYFLSVTITTTLFFILFIYSYQLFAKSQGISAIGISILIIVSGFLSFIGLSLTNSQIFRRLGVKKIIQIVPIAIIGILILSNVIGYIYTFSGTDIAYIRYFIITFIGAILVLGLTLGVHTPVIRQYFAPIDDRLENSIENMMLGSVKFIAIGVLGLALYLIFKLTSLSNLFNQWVIDSSIPLTLSFLALVGCISWFLTHKKLHLIYTDLLEESLDKQRNLIKHEHSFIESLVNILAHRVLTSGFPTVLTELKLLKVLDPILYRKALVNIVDHENESVQEYVIYEVQVLHLVEAISKLEKLRFSKYFNVLQTQRLILRTLDALHQSNEKKHDVKYVDQLTSSKLSEERLYGALLAPYISTDDRVKVLGSLYSDSISNIVFNAIIAAEKMEDTELLNLVINKLSIPEFGNGVVSVLSTSGDTPIELLETAFELNRKNQAVQQLILQIYGKIGTETAVGKLLDRLNYPNHNVIMSALDALSRCGFTITEPKMSLQVRTEISDVCEATIWSMSALLDARTHSCSEELISSLQVEIDNKYETLFKLLSLIYDPRSVESVKNNINSSEIEESEFASQLLDLFINDDLKIILIPIFKSSSYMEKIQDLQGRYPCQPMEKKELLKNIIFRDYKWINSWTKARALVDLEEDPSEYTADIFAAQIVNKNALLRETAALSLFKNFPDLFKDLKKRYDQKDQYNYVYQTIIDIEQKSGDQNAILKQDIANFLRSVNEFKGLSGVALAEISNVSDVMYYNTEEILFEGYSDSLDYWVVYSGAIEIDQNDSLLQVSDREMVYQFNITNNKKLVVKSAEQSTVIRIPKIAFEYIMTSDENIAKSILQNVSYKNFDALNIPVLPTIDQIQK